MLYSGSKAKISKLIVPIIESYRKEGQTYVEPFCGGCNVIDKISGKRIAADSNQYLINMWWALLDDWIPPQTFDESFYNDVKNNREKYFKFEIGWVGFCSVGGKFFGGWRKCKNNRDYRNEYFRNIQKQLPALYDVCFKLADYTQLLFHDNSLIYCDPPYEGTTGYGMEFNKNEFINWCRKMASKGHTVIVSESTMPDDFKIIFETSKTVRHGINKKTTSRTERLYLAS